MKVYYSRYEEISYIIILGEIQENEWKILQHGFNYLTRDMDKPLLIHLGNAKFDSSIVDLMIAFKEKIQQYAKLKVSIISKTNKIGDFSNLEGFYLKYQSKNMRLIIDRLKIEEETHLLDGEIQAIEDQLKQLGFDPATAKLEIQKNMMMNSQKTTLDSCLKWQKKRNLNLKKVTSEIVDLEDSITTSIADVKKALGKEVDL